MKNNSLDEKIKNPEFYSPAIAFFVAFFVLFIDQYSKTVVALKLSLGHEKIIIPHVLNFFFIGNPGAAFSLLYNHQTLLAFVSTTVAILILIGIYKYRYTMTTTFKLAWGLILGGTLGNLIDRLSNKEVYDFIKLTFINFPIFNIADIAINVGAAILIYRVFIRDQKLDSKTFFFLKRELTISSIKKRCVQLYNFIQSIYKKTIEFLKRELTKESLNNRKNQLIDFVKKSKKDFLNSKFYAKLKEYYFKIISKFKQLKDKFVNSKLYKKTAEILDKITLNTKQTNQKTKEKFASFFSKIKNSKFIHFLTSKSEKIKLPKFIKKFDDRISTFIQKFLDKNPKIKMHFKRLHYKYENFFRKINISYKKTRKTTIKNLKNAKYFKQYYKD